MKQLIATILLLAATALSAAADAPLRIVSINLLTDQWLLALAPREKIASVTWLSHDPDYSPMWALARKVPENRGTAEEVLRFKPDLVLAGRYAAAETVTMLERLGVRVVVFDYAPDFEGIAAQAREISKLIGEIEAGEVFVRSLERRLASVRSAHPAQPIRVLEYGQNGWTHGRGTVLDLLVREAGHINVASESGIEWMAQLPLERVIRMRPEGFIIPQRGDGAPSLASGVFDHSAFRGIAARGRVITMPPGTTDFGGPTTIDALEYLAAQLRGEEDRTR